jgi:hypothetical protein
MMNRSFAEKNMRHSNTRRSHPNSARPTGPEYRAVLSLPEAGQLRRFAWACRDLAKRETDSSRKALFREMESAWTAVAAQVERTDDLLTKLRASRCASLN